MTTSEAIITAALLRMAADRFSNHGCNDFDMARLIPSKQERDKIFRAYCEWNGDPEEYYETNSPEDYRLQDWALMDFMADRLA